jgi:hypothetical protein
MAKLLIDTVIRNIHRPISGQVEIADHADVKGFTLRVGKTGTKTFYLVYRSPEDGKQARIKLGTYPRRRLLTRASGFAGLSCWGVGLVKGEH